MNARRTVHTQLPTRTHIHEQAYIITGIHAHVHIHARKYAYAFTHEPTCTSSCITLTYRRRFVNLACVQWSDIVIQVTHVCQLAAVILRCLVIFLVQISAVDRVVEQHRAAIHIFRRYQSAVVLIVTASLEACTRNGTDPRETRPRACMLCNSITK